MKDNKQELSTEKMEKVSGGGWEQVIPLATEVVGKLMNSGGKDDSGSGQSAPANTTPTNQQNNSNNSGAQQNTQNGNIENKGGLVVNPK